MKIITQGYYDLLELFFPSLCVACGNRLDSQEKFLCVPCWSDLPVTNFHREPDNAVAQLFWGRARVEHATAYFTYRKGSNYQHLIHYIKYKGMKELGFEAGKRFGAVLRNSEPFAACDVLVPVPLHPKKQKLRGYNQSEWIARGIAQTMNKPVSVQNLKRKLHSTTQTRKNRFERWQNVENIFDLADPDEYSGRHVLLIDDVVTTGSTLEACIIELLNVEQVKVSIATLAFANS